MRLYNTLSRDIEEFQQQEPPVRIYSCGPTVYDYAHIGNLRAFVFTDTLRRTLEASGFTVRQVMNITDVGHLVSDQDEGEDKLEKGAEREGVSVWQIADLYTEAFKKDIARLNIIPPNAFKDIKHKDSYARATDFIEEQQEIVKILLNKGYAYQTEAAIYFDTAKLPTYGSLSRQNLDEQAIAVREEVVTDPSKRNPQDFAIWFFTVGRFAKHSMKWASPWGEGFPGWHLECSAIIHATLNDPIDIHTGGVDHIGTHHTNELAQTQAAFGNDLAKVWMHNEFMLVDGRKMSKSLGNIITLDAILERGYDPLALRLLYLQSHYRSQMNFTWEALESASNRLARWRDLAVRRYQPIAPAPSAQDINLADADSIFLSTMQNDLDSPATLAAIDLFFESVSGEDLSSEKIKFESYLRVIDNVLGLDLLGQEDIDDSHKKLIKQRDEFRASRQWDKADEIRKSLSSQGIELDDTPLGAIWHKTNP